MGLMCSTIHLYFPLLNDATTTTTTTTTTTIIIIITAVTYHSCIYPSSMTPSFPPHLNTTISHFRMVAIRETGDELQGGKKVRVRGVRSWWVGQQRRKSGGGGGGCRGSSSSNSDEKEQQ